MFTGTTWRSVWPVLAWHVVSLSLLLAISATTGDLDSTFCDVAVMGRLHSGVLTSYNYPFQYRHNLSCTYRIFVNNPEEETKKICFTFHRFSLESSTQFCSYDYLKFENTKYCGFGWWQYGSQNENPVANIWKGGFCWTVKEDHFDIYFNSDNNLNGLGFYATYTIEDSASAGSQPQEAPVGTAPCVDGEWTCFNRQCIGLNKLCDGEDNCGDGSDESYTHAQCGEQSVIACDFAAQQGGISDGYCGFTHEGWFRTNEQHSPYGPKGDHTNTTHGFYVYSDVNQSAAYLLSPELTLPQNRTYCLQFWYFVYGSPAAAALRVYVSRNQAYSQPEWTRTSAPEGEWLRGEVTFRTQHPLQAIFAAELDNSFSGVALDDISLLPGACTGNDISCNFESGPCSWTPTHSVVHHQGELHGDLTWRLHSRLIESVGPFWDHSSRDGSGSYLYLNYTTDKSKDNRALIVSPPVSVNHATNADDRRCLRFWYFMGGMDQDCALLRVRVHTSDDTLTDAVWSQHGDVRNAWKQASINLNGRNRPFQLVLEGIVSEGSRGELAIDELIMLDGPCSDAGGSACEPGQYLCHSGKCINTTLKCNGVPDCDEGSDEDWRAGCPTTTVDTSGESTCPPTHYRCHEDAKCIPISWVCDTFKDCTDESDENTKAGCPTSNTPSPFPSSCDNPEQYLCHNSVCIPATRRCDGNEDCKDGSDEINCEESTDSPSALSCPPQQFLCEETGQCILEEAVCDGHINCSDGSDESHVHCAKAVSSSSLGTGALIGLCVALLVILIIIVVLFVVCKRRRSKPATVRRPPHHTDSSISTISRYTYETTLDRHQSMLESLRAPIQQQGGPPPYSEQQNRAYTPERAAAAAANSNGVAGGSTRGHTLPPDEPPPPYDAVIKPGTTNNNSNNQNRRSSQDNQLDSSSPLRDSRRSPLRLNTVLPTIGQPNYQQQQGSGDQAPTLPPIPSDRPPISPPGGRTLPRIRLGTTPLHQPQGRPRNYINQSGPQYPPLGVPLNYMNYDTDGETSSVDHIYETLNLPDSRPQTPHALTPASSAPTINATGTGAYDVRRFPQFQPQQQQQQQQYLPNRGFMSPQTNNNSHRGQQFYPPPGLAQQLPMTSLSSPGGVGRGGASSYPQLARNNAMLRPSVTSPRGRSSFSPARPSQQHRPPVTNNNLINNYPTSYNNNATDDPLHSRTNSNLSQRSRTPDSQCHLLPASNNSSFDNTPNTNNNVNNTNGNNPEHPRQDSGASVVFSNLQDTLLPTNV